MRVGMIGGTFDPIHVGHLILAEQARDQLALEQVVFIPAGQPPHKATKQITAAHHRLAMVQLAIEAHDAFAVSRIDLDREGPCYSVDTISLLQKTWGSETEIYFLIGEDSLRDLPKWHQPDRLLRLCQIVAIRRPGYSVDLNALDRRLAGVADRIQTISSPLIDISSTDIRDRVRENRSIRYLVPEPVRRYIEQHNLYTSYQPEENTPWTTP
jgi:nicotinate-nucleotide adenylyltransferase